jgi:phospholipid/cholesterol/gamma-HCH transport system ATP-binding protein
VTSAIALRGLHKAFGGTSVLAGVDLEVPEGSCCVVLGVSGAGKSVLLKVLAGLIPADQGSVRLAGEELATADAQGLDAARQKLGILFQAGALFDSLTVAQNIAFPLRERLRLSEAEAAPRVARALEWVRLTGHGDRFPGELSGGMRKRAAFARAVVTEPPILLLDEPTAGLDPTTTELITDQLLAARASLGGTTLAITYNLQSGFRIADTIALLHQGCIVAHEAPQAFQANPHPAVRAFLRDWNQRPVMRRGGKLSP